MGRRASFVGMYEDLDGILGGCGGVMGLVGKEGWIWSMRRASRRKKSMF